MTWSIASSASGPPVRAMSWDTIKGSATHGRRTHARTPVLMLIQDLDIHIINATTGELIRDLTLDPTKDYQPQNQENR